MGMNRDDRSGQLATAPLRGADGYILDAIAGFIARDQPFTSYATLSAATGYTLPTVQAAVRRLERGGYISIRPGGPRCPNHYTLTPLGQQVVAGITQRAPPPQSQL